LAYTRAAAESLHAPKLYIDAVMGARPVLRSAGAAP
jgi:multicomponent K+:H+ antiporter subunit D